MTRWLAAAREAQSRPLTLELRLCNPLVNYVTAIRGTFMAFFQTEPEQDGRRQVKFFSREGEEIAHVGLGHDDETGAVYTVVVALGRTPYPGCWEIFFHVAEALPGEAVNYCNDGTQTKRFLKGTDRQHTLDLIAALVPMLAERVEHETLVMNTVETYLPRKALQKYEAICVAMRTNGYDARRGNSFHGTETWMMIRR